jgi:hypothetical protein
MAFLGGDRLLGDHRLRVGLGTVRLFREAERAMTDIDISKIKPGDYVTVRAQVLDIGADIFGSACFVHVKITARELRLYDADITGHEPAPEPLKIGDVVTVDNGFGASRFIVAALHGNNAWVHSAEKTINALFHVSRLRRVEQP